MTWQDEPCNRCLVVLHLDPRSGQPLQGVCPDHRRGEG